MNKMHQKTLDMRLFCMSDRFSCALMLVDTCAKIEKRSSDKY